MLCDRIKILRKERGMTLKSLAFFVSSGKSYMWEIENKEDISISANLVYRLAKVFGVTMEFIVNGDIGANFDAMSLDVHDNNGGIRL